MRLQKAEWGLGTRLQKAEWGLGMRLQKAGWGLGTRLQKAEWGLGMRLHGDMVLLESLGMLKSILLIVHCRECLLV